MRIRLAALLLLLGFANATVHAQAVPTATIPGNVEIGAGYVNANGDYGRNRMNGLFIFGAKYRYPIHRLSPYLKILIGAGNFAFGSSYQDGTYRIYSGGGGLDYRVTTHIVVRGDYEYQRWGTFPPRGLQPNVFSVGAAFRFH